MTHPNDIEMTDMTNQAGNSDMRHLTGDPETNTLILINGNARLFPEELETEKTATKYYAFCLEALGVPRSGIYLP